MPKTTHLTLTLESKPGVLAKVARTLASAGVNITAVSTTDTAGKGKIRLLTSDPARAAEVLKGAKYRVAEEPAVIVRLDNRPGALASTCEKLAQAKINIKHAYATTTEGGQATVVLVVGNADKAVAALGGS